MIAYDGKLPTTSKRPRFKFSEAQAEIVFALSEINEASTLARMDIDALKTPVSGRTPINLLRAGAMDEVLDMLRRISFEASLRRR